MDKTQESPLKLNRKVSLNSSIKKLEKKPLTIENSPKKPVTLENSPKKPITLENSPKKPITLERKLTSLESSSPIKKPDRKPITFESDSGGKNVGRKPILLENSQPKAQRQKITFESPKNAKQQRKKIKFGNSRGNSFKNGQDDSSENEEERLNVLQPELLPVTIMNELLKQRGADASILTDATRNEVAKLFYKHISPKPQRIYKDTRIGRILHKLQLRFSKKESDVSEWEKLVKFKSSKRSLAPTSSATSHAEATLDQSLASIKPASSPIALGAKKLKLSSNSTSSDLNFTIAKRNSSKNSLANSSQELKRGSDGDPADKKVKRRKTVTEECSSPSKDTEQKSKNRPSISWP